MSVESAKVTRRWYHWYAPDDGPDERRLILKLDLLIVPFAFIGYWLKYVDQANLNNAYVTGMKQDLGFNGNELVHCQTIYTVGAVIGQLPFTLLFTKVPMNYLVPAVEFLWGIFTLLQYRVKSYAELMAYRFFVGFFEAPFFPAVHFVLGSWYRGDEYGRRGGVFYIGLTLGVLTASLIQAGTSAGLDGVHGLAGWRWMYIINAIMTLPLGIVGFFIWPGTPDKPNRFILKERDLALSKARLWRKGHSTPQVFSWRTVTRSLTNWKFYLVTWWGIVFWNSTNTASAATWLLWMSSLKRYSPSHLNSLASFVPALGIFYVLFICFSSDLYLGRPLAITLAQTFNCISIIILTVWDVPEGAKWFAFALTFTCVSNSSVLYGWINDFLKHDVAERAFIFTLANAIAQSTTAWTLILTFKTVEAPRFRKGYPFALSMALLTIITTWVFKYLHDRQEAQYAAEGRLAEDQRAAQEILGQRDISPANVDSAEVLPKEAKAPSLKVLEA